MSSKPKGTAVVVSGPHKSFSSILARWKSKGRTSMAKKSRDNKVPPIRLEFNGRIPDAVSRVFEALTGLLCEVLQHLRLRMRITNERLRESLKKKKG